MYMHYFMSYTYVARRCLEASEPHLVTQTVPSQTQIDLLVPKDLTYCKP